MAFTPKLTYKGKPLVRKDNELYYGRMTDPYVLYLQILTTTPVGDQQVADKVHLMLLSTDTTKAPQERVARQTTKHGLYNALDMERVVWSNDIEDFKPATDVKDDKTIGGKYMDLVKTDAAQLTKVEKTSGKDTYEITVGGDTYDKVPTDVSDLIGLKVKVLIKEKSNGDTDVYGVYADDDSKIIATGTVGELKSVSGENKKTKLKDTEYKLDNDKSTVNAIEPNVSTTVKLTDLEGYTAVDKVAGTIKLIDTNGNNKADVVVYIPAVVGKITYVGSKSITINNGVGSQDIDDLDIYTGYAKDDYVAVVDDGLTASGNYGVTKLDTTSAKVNSIKSSTPVEVKINDSWFKIATGSVADDTASVKSGSTYDFVTVGNYVVNAKETESASSEAASSEAAVSEAASSEAASTTAA